MSTICRTCLKLDKTESCSYASLNSVIPESDCLSLRDKLLACVPELSINLVPDPSICNSCVSALQITYQFWSSCLQTEETIRNYVQKNALRVSSVDLNNLVEFQRTGLAELQENIEVECQSVEIECETVDVECSSPIEMHVEPDLIDINYLLPVAPAANDSIEQSVKEEVKEIDIDDNPLEYFENYSNQNEEVIEVIIKSEDTEENVENASQNNPHVCYKCGRCFTSQGSLNRHAKSHLTSKNKWNGPKNMKRSTLPLKRVNEHLSRENAKKPHMCDVCGKCYLKKATLKTHMNVHTGEKPYRCDVCKKQFNFKNNLQRHMLLHDEGGAQKRFKCNICEKLFARREHLSKHMISHTDGEPYQCTLCNKPFKYMDSLRGHLKYHSGEKRFRCEICGNGFIRRDNLHVHLRTVHADENPIDCDADNEERSYEEQKKILPARTYYKCKTCGKLCKSKPNLRVHSNIHLKEKPYKCSICNHAFSQRGTLTYHIRTHTGEKPFTCFVCDRSFTQKATLRGHLQTHRSKSGVLVKEEDIDVEENALEIC